ncbi:hypothetical protein BGZ79_009316 [Entomortierella chlamydospora]|nr:hypothetical protein BGZ79_009316 [Entomortierella chlamydospora]
MEMYLVIGVNEFLPNLWVNIRSEQHIWDVTTSMTYMHRDTMAAQNMTDEAALFTTYGGGWKPPMGCHELLVLFRPRCLVASAGSTTITASVGSRER